ncbi:LOW QUALITY PROTEIN: hypothetical protein V2J09_010380 [Rumex salicifolius]
MKVVNFVLQKKCDTLARRKREWRRPSRGGKSRDVQRQRKESKPTIARCILVLNDVGIELECLGENVNGDGRFRPEDGVGNGGNSGVLAAECGDGKGIGVTGVELEVNESLREDEHVTRVEHLCEELVGAGHRGVGGHKPYRVPSRRVSTSVARGWKCGATRPLGAKSRRAREIPSVLSPPRLDATTGVTAEPIGLLVSPALLNPLNKKSSAVT